MTQDWARPLVEWEIVARDPQKVRDFYTRMFNWTFSEDGPLLRVPPGIGGPEPAPAGHIIPGGESRFVLYFQVRDLRASLEMAKELGGSVLQEPFDVPNGPTVARIADPEGNPVGLVQQ